MPNYLWWAMAAVVYFIGGTIVIIIRDADVSEDAYMFVFFSEMLFWPVYGMAMIIIWVRNKLAESNNNTENTNSGNKVIYLFRK